MERTALAIRKVGDCRILGPLGKGGMAQVYRGIHEQLQREVAIKELAPERAKSPEVLSRFKREALALAAFRHQHIVTLYDLIEKNDGWYMVMELVDGPTLLELVKEAPLPGDVVAVMGFQLAQALEHAHFRKVVHRDLKPANIMLSRLGETKLMDFGIAQNEDLDRLTKVGLAVGTPAYMSPEQITGAQVDVRSDVYSLGVVLYEALTGQKPYSGTNAGEVFAKVMLGKYPPLRKVAPKTPKPLRGVIEQMMERRPRDRFQDITQVRRAFETMLVGVPRSMSSMLVGFLLARQRISESEALARLSQTELTQKSAVSLREIDVRRSRWGLAMFVGVVIGLAAALAPHWLPLLELSLRSLRR